MQRLEGKTFNAVEKNIEKLKRLFPEVLTENKIDVEKLLVALGEHVETEKERYEFNWNGKGQAIQLAQKQTTGTLRPNIEGSLDFNTSKNLYIEGDNLEVLRVLQSSYRNRIKMIYIDPPYNTGTDFVYKDNFHDNLTSYKERMDERMKSNADTSGRYHTEWLNMMYPRLKIARNLLADDGVIFISIDDHEVENLKRICNEIFGEENFVTSIVIKTSEPTGVKMTHVRKRIPKLKEYVLCYKKYDTTFEKISVPKEKWDREYKTILLNVTKDEVDELKNIRDGDARDPETLNRCDEILAKVQFVSVSQVIQEKQIEKAKVDDFLFENAWRIIRTVSMTGNAKKLADEKKLKNNERAFVINTPNNKLYFIDNQYNPDVESPRIKILFADDYLTVHPCDFWQDIKTTGLDNEGFVEYRNGKKPLKMMDRLLNLAGLNDEDLVLDFFSGSGTTGEAVIRYGIKNQKAVNYILVQINEDLTKSVDKLSGDAKKDTQNLLSFLEGVGRKPVLSELGKERMTRVKKELQSQYEYDFGFKNFTLDDTNLKQWDEGSVDLEQDLINLIQPVKEDRSQEDVVYEILLKYGMELTLPIKELKVADKTVFSVAGDQLLLCLEQDLTLHAIEEIASMQPARVIFYDESFQNDTVRTNAEQILKSNGIEDIRVI
ncbi:site-specific DNA-methyltransferase [Cytobacillus spongiae]|uniref:site-specific DNA-methyltransferase n=1 Tax=Cytobacillus spongiae TaxID=2901381 RepID=UPI001F2658F4|nr:site-specific DNA-methyltransferase [Cytobacillus spongiae]UII57087.1 site-specific DNA-methyltransferase [Cytobacillus spongiae]